nr:MAG TPA: hypothetical protein [Caudoviricetes sp.]
MHISLHELSDLRSKSNSQRSPLNYLIAPYNTYYFRIDSIAKRNLLSY